MAALGMTGFVIGFVLGLRFRVMVLVPLGLLAVVAATVAACTTAGGWPAALLGSMGFAASSQIGYALALALPAALRRAGAQA